jgi:pimeloyl-ACP methyl ester carboxylesterase
LRDAGVSQAIRTFDWPYPGDSFHNLIDLPGNRGKAAEVAESIRDYARQYPDAPIDLVGYSGGGGIALLVVEALQPASQPAAVDADAASPDYLPHIRNVVLVQPAISPDFDLTPVLRAITGQLVNFHCGRDWLILGAGTTIFGTIDRKFVASAGKIGFDAAKAIPDESLRDKLVQVAWSREMSADGHGGDHLGGLWRPWNRKYVAPYLK